MHPSSSHVSHLTLTGTAIDVPPRCPHLAARPIVPPALAEIGSRLAVGLLLERILILGSGRLLTTPRRTATFIDYNRQLVIPLLASFTLVRRRSPTPAPGRAFADGRR